MYKRKEEMKDIAMFFAIAGGWLLVIAVIIAMSVRLCLTTQRLWNATVNL